MAPSKRTMLFVCLLVSALAVAQATLIDISDDLNSVVHIYDTIYCSVNGTATVGPNGVKLTPAFSNATVELRCGAGKGTVIASVQTNDKGVVSIVVDLKVYPLKQLLSDCHVMVATPLAKCNATLPSTGYLTSPLKVLGNPINLCGKLTLIKIVLLGLKLTLSA